MHHGDAVTFVIFGGSIDRLLGGAMARRFWTRVLAEFGDGRFGSGADALRPIIVERDISVEFGKRNRDADLRSRCRGQADDRSSHRRFVRTCRPRSWSVRG